MVRLTEKWEKDYVWYVNSRYLFDTVKLNSEINNRKSFNYLQKKTK